MRGAGCMSVVFVSNMKILVMENLFAERTILKIYDLKGLTLFRRNPPASKVLLDQNLLDDMLNSSIVIDSISKRQLEEMLLRDTRFLERNQLIDYSLIIGVDEDNKQLVSGMIDYLQDYSLKKQIEFLGKSLRNCFYFLGGYEYNFPTVTPPHIYGERFRQAICGYFEGVSVPE